jgi:hypothetical protein
VGPDAFAPNFLEGYVFLSIKGKADLASPIPVD